MVNGSSKMRIGLALLLSCCMAGCGPSVHELAASPDFDALKRAIEADPSLVHARDDLEKTPLHHAAAGRSIETLAFLVEHGADVNAADKTGLRPIHISAWWGTRLHVKVLLELGADINATDLYDDTPLHLAAMARDDRANMIAFLVEHGASLTARNERGLTPEEAAAGEHREKHVALLHRLAAP